MAWQNKQSVRTCGAGSSVAGRAGAFPIPHPYLSTAGAYRFMRNKRRTQGCQKCHGQHKLLFCSQCCSVKETIHLWISGVADCLLSAIESSAGFLLALIISHK